jgi:hypothetical protein
MGATFVPDSAEALHTTLELVWDRQVVLAEKAIDVGEIKVAAEDETEEGEPWKMVCGISKDAEFVRDHDIRVRVQDGPNDRVTATSVSYEQHKVLDLRQMFALPDPLGSALAKGSYPLDWRRRVR